MIVDATISGVRIGQMLVRNGEKSLVATQYHDRVKEDILTFTKILAY